MLHFNNPRYRVHDTLIKNGDKVANAKLSDKIIVNLMKELASIGVEIDVTKDKIDLSKLYEKRKIGSIMDLGFTPDNIEECMLWCIDVSKQVKEQMSDYIDHFDLLGVNGDTTLQAFIFTDEDAQPSVARKLELTDDNLLSLNKQVDITYVALTNNTTETTTFNTEDN